MQSPACRIFSTLCIMPPHASHHYTANKILFIDASRGSGLPCVLVSCKCDNPPPIRQLEPGTLGQLGGSLGRVDTRQPSSSKPQTQKQCISIILRAILTRSKGE